MKRLFTLLTAAFLSTNSFATEFTLSSNAFSNEGLLPTLYTCDGKDSSPAFTWENAPAETQSFAFLITDPDAPSGNWYHWVVYNIPVGTKSLPANAEGLPPEVLIGKNSWNKEMYNGPCPPKGSSHAYVFTLYALDTKLELPAGADGQTVENTLKRHIVGVAVIKGTYSRWIGG